MNSTIWGSPRAFAVVVLMTLVAYATPANADQHAYAQDSENTGAISFGIVDRSISVTIPTGDYEIADAPEGRNLFVDGFGHLLVPGKPKLPSKIFAIAIPPGAELVNVSFDPGQGVDVPGTHQIAPTPLSRVIGQEDPERYAEELQRYEANFEAVYGSDDSYPRNVGEFVRTAGYREYNLVDVRITPFTYRPETGRLTYHPQVNVCVKYQLADDREGIMVHDQPRTKAVADRIIFNDDQAKDWYFQGGPRSKGLYDYVIITLDSLTSSVTPLVNWETVKGRTVTVVTTSWIDANYDGGYDLASDIRAFLREKYPSGEWGIEDVLIVGHYDDVPMRRCEQDLGYGKPETDYYYAELSLPDNQSWDSNGNHLYGEDSDSLDYYGEVNIGRIPYSSPSIVQGICEKSVDFEQNSDPSFKKNILLLGAYFWEDTDNAELMEAKVDQPWMSDWTMTRMYEQGYSTFAMNYNLTYTNVRNVWSAGTYAFVNWAGHGSPTSSHIMYTTGEGFVTNTTCSYLNDDYPAIIFADACSNQDTDEDNIGWAMMGQGGVGFVGATKVALGCPGWNDQYDGSSQSMDCFFTKYVTSGDYTQGQAHQQALTNMYTYGLWSYNKYETFEWGALLGNPNLGMGTPSPLNLSLPGGIPEYLEPGVLTTITVQITDGSESYVSGSGRLHYRYSSGGKYLTSNLVHDTGDLYNATLLATACDDTPEFYISAQGDLGTTVVSPSGAPANKYSAIVGQLTTIFEDHFETNQGWTTGDDGLATSGLWQRGDPVNDPNWDYAPAADSDGSGQCWLTENDNNPAYTDPYNTDVDDGAVYLYSPILDLSGGNVTISYDYYLNLTNTNGDDRLLVEISSNGSSGPWTEIARHNTSGETSWRSHTITQGDLDAAGVTLNSNMMFWFTANDGGTQSINESGLDSFLITGFSCEEADCPFTADGDINGDGIADGEDIQLFVSCILGEPTFNEMCHGDFNEDTTLSVGDIDGMVSAILVP